MRSIFLFIILIGGIHLSNAQQANRIQRGQRGYTPPPRLNTNAFIEVKDVQQELAIILPKCEEIFGLDTFEKEIMKNILTKKFETENAILQDDKNSRDDRREKIITLNNQLFADLQTILTPTQIETFKNLDFTEASDQEKRDEKRKRKKKRRKNKDKDS